MEKKPKSESLRERTYKKIKERILFIEYKPGEKIFESDLVKELQISRTPIREALLILEKENLVECDDRLGFIVRRLNAGEIDEYFKIRGLLEIYAVPLIIERITPSEIEALDIDLREAESCPVDSGFRCIIRHNIQFHKLLWQSAKSEVFFRTIDSLSNMFLWYRAIGFVDQKSVLTSIKEHKELLSAIKEKDAKSLKKITRRHLQNAKKGNKALHGFLI